MGRHRPCDIPYPGGKVYACIPGPRGETVIRQKDTFLLASELRAAFEAGCQTNGLTPANATTFGRRMTALNFRRKKVGGLIRYESVALRGAWPLTVIDGAKARTL
jgi:hypothetical protein